jgi:DNA polymerase III epsilon subunit family exonuclease
MARATPHPEPESQGRYEALSESAVAFVTAHGGSVHEDALVAHVFGRSASPALWRSLLQSALVAEERLSYTADGRWILSAGLPGAPVTAESLLSRFIAIDVETTGLKPTSQRIIEVALVRFEDGVETGRFNRLVNPGRRIPDYISKLTGIRNDDVADAAGFGALADEIVEFLGGEILVGHNVGFDIGFLNAELQRVHIAKLVNESVDTLTLATRVIPGLRRPSLDRVARQVGLSPRKIHRAGVDATLTAEVALRLEAEARRQGVASLDALRVLATPRERSSRNKVGRGRSLVDRSLLEGIPRRPGVYIFRDAEGQVLYVGKAKNLRERVSTYFSQQVGYARKLEGLMEAIATIDTEVVGSELEALLLEAQLIRRYTPRYNSMMRAFEHYPYIRVDVSNRWPRVTLVKDRKDDGARYFGPYRSRNAARKTVDVINDVLPLRTCTRSFRDARSYGNPCMRLALGKCMGPCVDTSIRDEYRAIVHQVIRFLDGDDDALYEVLWRALEEAAERQDFERAEKLRRNLAMVNGIVAGHRELRVATERHHLLLAAPSIHEGERELWMVLEGRVWSRLGIGSALEEDVVLSVRPASDGDAASEDQVVADVVSGTTRSAIGDPEGLVERLMASWDRYLGAGVPPVSHDSLDDTHILNRWIAGHSDHPAVMLLDRERASAADYWRELLERALRLPDDCLVLDVTGPGAMAVTSEGMGAETGA